MDKKHLKSELAFYSKAFSDNKERRNKKYGWEFVPSKAVMDLVKKHALAKNASAKRVLDIGCGDGRHVEYFSKLGFEVWGIDFSNEAIGLCKKRFSKNSNVHLATEDATAKNAFSKLGKFDIVLDWSVLDHIRAIYVRTYLKNITGAIKHGGYAFFVEFDRSIPGLFKSKKFKVINGHYSRAYSPNELTAVLKPLKRMDQKLNIREDRVNNYVFNAVLMKKT